jgi:hypothetical protein
VFGVGRPSLVDFEDHEYAKQPVPKALETISPEEIAQEGVDREAAPAALHDGRGALELVS